MCINEDEKNEDFECMVVKLRDFGVLIFQELHSFLLDSVIKARQVCTHGVRRASVEVVKVGLDAFDIELSCKIIHKTYTKSRYRKLDAVKVYVKTHIN